MLNYWILHTIKN